MAVAVVVVMLVVATVLFHFVSPWRATPLASNWQQMDDTLAITLVITGIFFVVISLFIAYTVFRFRHREGSKAAYQPENKKLERWLIGGTSVGIMALLAPGLLVYGDYITPPPDALTVEVLGQQWQWRYRLPGTDGKLGKTDVRYVSAANPFGIDPADPAGGNNVLVNSNELHLPLHKPVRMLLRSIDVLHDFYVPEFRARMNMVPGMVTTFWFTPTRVGRFEVLCAQLCGVAHYNMRGYVVVEDEPSYHAWLKGQPTFMTTMAATQAGQPALSERAIQGRSLAQSKGCVACHTTDGGSGVGPTWKGLFDKTETMADGSTAHVDEAYLKDFIRNPQSRVVKGFAPIMPKIEMSDDELAALVEYIKTFRATGPGTPRQRAEK
ncbi:MAG: coxM [Herminiimonas sp.]|nr:coxM [Herminiimonas sp.]MDB5852702.1 coxM [Herminiimonas sp.]